MSVYETEYLEAMQQNPICPQCEYNLRGLPGDVVECPECGMLVDLGKLFALRWNRAWYMAPGLHLLLKPLRYFLIIAPVLFVSSLIINAYGFIHPIIIVCFAITIGVCIWGCFLVQAYYVFNDLKGVWLSLFAHLLFAGYMVGLSFSLCFLYGISQLFHAADPCIFIASLIPSIMGVAIIFLCRRMEKFIAGQCIQMHLRRNAGVLDNKNP